MFRFIKRTNSAVENVAAGINNVPDKTRWRWTKILLYFYAPSLTETNTDDRQLFRASVLPIISHYSILIKSNRRNFKYSCPP